MTAESNSSSKIPALVVRSLGIDETCWAEAETDDSVLADILDRAECETSGPPFANLLKEVAAASHDSSKHMILAAAATLRNPDNPLAWHQLGIGCTARSLWPAASQCYEAVFRLEPRVDSYTAWHAALAALMANNPSLLVASSARFPLRTSDARFGIVSQLAAIAVQGSGFTVEDLETTKAEFDDLAPWIKKRVRAALFRVVELTVRAEDRHALLRLVDLGSSLEIDAVSVLRHLEARIDWVGEVLALPTHSGARGQAHVSGSSAGTTGEPAARSMDQANDESPHPPGMDRDAVDRQLAHAIRARDDLEAARVAHMALIAALQEQVDSLLAERSMLREQVLGQQAEIEQQHDQLTARAAPEGRPGSH